MTELSGCPSCIQGNGFWGEPAQPAAFNNLHVVYLSNNNFTSLLLGRYLVAVQMAVNGLTGTLPDGISDMLSLNTLDLRNNEISVGVIIFMNG